MKPCRVNSIRGCSLLYNFCVSREENICMPVNRPIFEMAPIGANRKHSITVSYVNTVSRSTLATRRYVCLLQYLLL